MGPIFQVEIENMKYSRRRVDCNLISCRGLKGPLSPGREKRGGTDSDRDSELELDYAQCKYTN